MLVDPPMNTKGLDATKDAVTVNVTLPIQSIFALEKLKPYGPEELRVFDYISKGVIEKMPDVSRGTHGAGGTGLFGSEAVKKEEQKPTTTTPTGGVFATVQQQTTQEKNIDWDYAVQRQLVTRDTGNISTAADYFKSGTRQVLVDTEVELAMVRKVDDADRYWRLFNPVRMKARIERDVEVSVIHVNPELLRPAAYMEPSKARKAEESLLKFKTVPPLSQIRGTSTVVPNFRIMKENVASIDFQKTVDVGAVDFEQDIAMSRGFVDIYRTKRTIPQEGTGLNTDAIVSMWGIWPKDPETGNRVEITDPEKIKHYKAKLKEFCAKKHANFAFYIPERGFFQFVVPNFLMGPYVVP